MNVSPSKKHTAWTSSKPSTCASPAAVSSTSRSTRRSSRTDRARRSARPPAAICNPGTSMRWRNAARRVQARSLPSASPAKTRATSSPNIRSIPSRCSAPTRSAARSMACSSTARSASTATTPAGRLAQYKKNFEFFDAPVALFITIDRRLGPGQWADLGGYIHALAFLARGYGLDTCPQEAWARLYDTVGDFLKLPAERDAVLRHGDRLRRQEAQGQRLPLAARRIARVLQVLRIRLVRPRRTSQSPTFETEPFGPHVVGRSTLKETASCFAVRCRFEHDCIGHRGLGPLFGQRLPHFPTL